MNYGVLQIFLCRTILLIRKRILCLLTTFTVVINLLQTSFITSLIFITVAFYWNFNLCIWTPCVSLRSTRISSTISISPHFDWIPHTLPKISLLFPLLICSLLLFFCLSLFRSPGEIIDIENPDSKRRPIISRTSGVVFSMARHKLVRPGQVIIKVSGMEELAWRVGNLLTNWRVSILVFPYFLHHEFWYYIITVSVQCSTIDFALMQFLKVMLMSLTKYAMGRVDTIASQLHVKPNYVASHRVPA